MHNPKTGDMVLRHYSGSLPPNFDSHHREIKFSVPPRWDSDKTFLTAELSLPKLWYGHNVSLLYNWRNALESLRSLFNQAFQLHTKSVLTSVNEWVLTRVDFCYNWKFPTQDTAQSFLDSLKGLKYPRKSSTIRPTSISFVGETYSFKFYLKHPEFRAHDLKKMAKMGASLEWIEHIEKQALGVLRAEATCRAKYLRRLEIVTVDDLLKIHRTFEIKGIEPVSEAHQTAAILFASNHRLPKNKDGFVNFQGETPLENGVVTVVDQDWALETDTVCFFGEPFTLICKSVERPTRILQNLLSNFVGDDPAMRRVDKVQIVLEEHYKSQKAARLTAFWLYCRHFGSEKAKEKYGRDSFYAGKRDLKNAGVSLIDEVTSKVIELDQSFIDNFRLVIPSEYTTNKFDDFRDGQNLLNLPQAQ